VHESRWIGARLVLHKIVRQFFIALSMLLAVRPTAAEVSFTKDIAPIFVAKCLGCHNAEKAKGGYRLHSFDALMKPGSSKDAPIVAGKSSESILFQLITAKDEDERMPQKDDALPAAQIGLIKQWIEQGARFDGTNAAVALAVISPPQHPAAPRTYPVPIPITALAFDVAGERLAASGYHEVTIWNSSSSALLQRIGNIAERTFDLAFSSNGRWLACASGTPGKIGEVKLFNATNGELARVLVTTADAELCLAFSADNKFLAAGGADNVIRIWEVESGKQLQSIEQHADWVLALAFSPDDEELASGSRDKSARVFDVKTGELEKTHSGHGDFVVAVGWPDNKTVVSVARDRTAHRWNAHDDKKSSELSGWEAAPTRCIVAQGKLFSSALDGAVREHSLETKEITRSFAGPHDAVYSLAFHAASKRLAAGVHTGEVFVWSGEDGKMLLKFLAAPGYAAKLSRSE
jgi:WD40 repeat protein